MMEHYLNDIIVKKPIVLQCSTRLCDVLFKPSTSIADLHYEIDSDLEGKGHILFPVVDYMGVHINVNSLQPIVCDFCSIKCQNSCLSILPLNSLYNPIDCEIS